VERPGVLQLGEGAAVGVHVHDHLTLGELEGALVAGEVAGGQGPSYVQGLLAAEVGQALGAGGDGVVEVQGVGEVEGAADVDGADVGDLSGVDVEAPAISSGLAAGFGFGRVEPDPGFLHDAFELGERELRGDRCDVGVHEPGTLERQRQGGFGDLPGLPHRHPAGHDEGPGLGEPVTDLDGLAEVGPPGVGGLADREGELGDAELRDQGCAVAGDGQLALPHGGGSDRVDRVHRGPVHGPLEHPHLGRVGRVLVLAGGSQHRTCGVEFGGGCHGSTQALTTDSQTPKRLLYTGF
jgi:hypothetical protein